MHTVKMGRSIYYLKVNPREVDDINFSYIAYPTDLKLITMLQYHFSSYISLLEYNFYDSARAFSSMLWMYGAD
jgi:hypothetical protein